MAIQDHPSIEDFALRRTLQVERYAAGVAVDELFRALERAAEEIGRKLERMGGAEASMTRTRYLMMQGTINAALADVAVRYRRSLTRSMRDVANIEHDKARRLLMQARGQTMKQSGAYLLPKDQIEAMMRQPIGGKFLDDWIETHLGATKARIRGELTQSIIQSETTAQAAARLRNSLEISRRGADMIARTALNGAGNFGREAGLARHKDVIKRWRAVATLDERTCIVCATYDGKEDEDRGNLPKYPLHMRCRCVVVPVTVFDDRQNKRPAVTEQSKKVVHHRDGTTSTKYRVEKAKQVPASTKFRDFFDRQPASWQRDYLGRARYDLYKQGKLSLADMVRNDRILTLRELRA